MYHNQHNMVWSICADVVAHTLAALPGLHSVSQPSADGLKLVLPISHSLRITVSQENSVIHLAVITIVIPLDTLRPASAGCFTAVDGNPCFCPQLLVKLPCGRGR